MLGLEWDFCTSRIFKTTLELPTYPTNYLPTYWAWHSAAQAFYVFIMYYPLHKVQLFPRDFEELKESDMEFFLCRERPILGIDALPHPDPQSIFVPQLLDVPEIRSEFSGRSGFEKHFGDMLGEQTG